ncbi:MAG: S9 family peptidase [Deltaproteobacteria bacterium]|nr:S9 family peptidase [Deltaproteobacteria bacterium]
MQRLDRVSPCALALTASLLLGAAPAAQAAAAEPGYRQPPKAVLDVLRAPLPPNVSLNPTRDTMILATLVRYPPIAYLAQPMLRLAGVRVLPANRGDRDSYYWSEFVLTRVADGGQQRVALPKDARAGWPVWSADGKRYAFTNTASDAVELWLGERDRPTARRVAGVRLNPMLGDELQWLPDQRTLLLKTVPRGQGKPPVEPATPAGPAVQETAGGAGASSTYELRDVLKSPHDEALFEYYATSQLVLLDVVSGKLTRLGKPAMFANVDVAPDGQHILIEIVQRPFSYLTTHDNFPRLVEIWDRRGRPVHRVASLPLFDSVPIWGVPTGPRSFEWRPTEPATLIWAEAQDRGDWNVQVPHRDRIMLARAPFQEPAREVARTEQRFGGLWWSERSDLALLVEYDSIKHWTRTFAVDLDDPQQKQRLIWDHSTHERYRHPGWPVMHALPNGFWVMEQYRDSIFLSGRGASPAGDRPFLDRLDLRTLKTYRLFRSGRDSYESFVAWRDYAKGQFVTRRESPTEPPNIFVRTLGAPHRAEAAGEPVFDSTASAVTRWPDPTPQLRGITKQLVKYQRADGVELSFTLYLPPGYRPGTRLPTVVWAYPLDYADPQMAGQVAGSTQRFTVLGWPLHLFLLLDGYAVIDNPALPVVGDTNKIYDTYLEQLIAGARAAVDKAVEMGVTDRDRIGVTGHSHGGLMTVNLLTHTDLFRAGIARSGAYNRTLTAFGFQNERRTLWQAPAVYTRVSPFFHVDELKRPLLLIHGADDPNPGTTPLQSEKLFEAIRGNGGAARLVMLPHEGHGYRALESTEHALWEMLTWFDRHVKNAPPRGGDQETVRP